MTDLSHSQHQTEAATLLIHYLSTAYDAAGLSWGSDNDDEVRSIVDNLAAAAREAAQSEVRAHSENEPHIYADGSTS